MANETVTSDGALLFAGFAPGGAKNDAVGSQSSTFHEWILRPNSLYLFRISNDSGGDVSFSLEVDVYEPGLAT